MSTVTATASDAVLISPTQLLALQAAEPVVLIDTRPTPRMARDFLPAIRTVTDNPIRTIVLTH